MAVLQLGLEWSSTYFLYAHPLGVPNIFSEEAETISVIKAILLFFMCWKAWEKDQWSKEANSISMDLLLMNSRHTDTGPDQDPEPGMKCHQLPLPASLAGFSSTLLTPTYAYLTTQAPVLTPGPLISCGEEQVQALGSLKAQKPGLRFFPAKALNGH